MYSLSPLDYVIISAMLLVSIAIGVYFAFRSRGNHSPTSYFLGDRNMSVIPVAISLTVSYISAITYFGTPAEVYIYGPKYALMATIRLFYPLLIVYWVIPVFYRLEITTVFQYLEMRFNNTVRFLVLVLETVGALVYMGIVVYTPALALSTLNGMPLAVSILTLGLICTFYSTIGGIKAVIWTDVFQAATMVVGTLIMITVGILEIGGLGEVWRRAGEGERTEVVDFNLDPTVRLTFWTIYIGGATQLWMTFAIKQTYIQRYLACKSERGAQAAAYIGQLGMAVMELLGVTTGIVIFAYYYSCDPLMSGRITRPDQIVPFFVMDLFHSAPGLPGFMMAGAFSAFLSTMSSVINAVASIAGQDFIKTVWPDISDYRYDIAVKIVSAITGLLGIALAFLASVLGDVLQTALSVTSLTGGPVLGVFIIGLFFPRGNSIGATAGLVSGTLVGLFFYIGSQIYPPITPYPPLSVSGCSGYSTNATTPTQDALVGVFTEDYSKTTSPDGDTHENGPAIFGLSFLYLSTVTSVTSVVIGLVVSYVTSRNNRKFPNRNLLATFIARGMANSVDDNEHTEKTSIEESIPIQRI